MVEKVKKKELCIVHIGMPKTGSSSLQEALYGGILDQRVSYANLPEANQSGRVAGLFMDKPENYHYFSNRGWNINKISEFKEKNKQLLIQGFLNYSTSIEIISGEDLFHLSESAITRMRLFLNEYFEKVLIVAYVRPVKSFMESAFQQLVKNHYLGDFDFSKIYHRYKNFEKYDNVFGKENVLLWKFEPKNFPKGDILLDFSQRLNLESEESKQKKFNESLSLEAISILFTYHFHLKSKTQFGDEMHFLNHQLVYLIRKIGNTPFRFSNEVIESVIGKYSDDYRWIKVRMNDDFFEDSLSSPVQIKNKYELMNYSTNYINDLIDIIGIVNLPSGLIINNAPQDVAKLVDILMVQLQKKSARSKI